MNSKIRKLAYTAMFAVLNYIVFTYGKINITITEGSSTAIHLANAVVVLSSWFLGPVYGGLAGAVGLSLADLLDPRYITSAPKTFILKYLIAFISGSVANKLKLRETDDRKEIVRITTISAISGLGFNVIFDPLFGFFYRQYILGIQQTAAKIIASWVAGTTFINAVICVIVSILLYQSLYRNFKNKLY